MAELIFKELDQTGTLVHVGDANHPGEDLELGSLSFPLGRQFDIVIGNPPWTKLAGTSSSKLNPLVRNIALSKGVPAKLAKSLRVKHGVPDIPFLWRSLDWAKSGGMIGLALHAQHVLFQQDAGADIREALLGCIEITGILNGSALRQEKVWPNVDAPFCLLLARNNPPSENSAFYYLSPVREPALNGEGRMRLDPHMATAVAQNLARTSRYIFKALFRGTSLDHGVVGRIVGHPDARPLEEYWQAHGLKSGMGFRATGKEEVDASYLHHKKIFEVDDPGDYEINVAGLRPFAHPYIHRRCPPAIFNGPVVLLRSPKSNREDRGGLLACDDVVYAEAFIGYSTAGHRDAKALAHYLHLLSYSDLFLYGLLMTSSKFGAECDAILKEDIETFPFIPFESLSSEQRERTATLCRSLIAGECPWNDIDEFFFDLYGLTAADRQVIQDTLKVGLPFGDTLDFAEGIPEDKTFEVFVDEFKRIVQPFAQRLGHRLRVGLETIPGASHWKFVRVGLARGGGSTGEPLPIVIFAKALADDVWASQVRIHEADGCLIVGQIAQNRYWTITRARLLALDILNAGLDQLAGDKGSVH